MKLVAAVVVALLPLAGCDGTLVFVTDPPSTPTSATTSQATDQPTSGSEVDMCSLIPLADVQAKSPFQTPLAQFTSGVVPGMCEYRSADDAEAPVSVLLVVTAFQSAADAETSLSNARQAAVDSGLPFDDLDSLGDAAFSSGSDEVGVHARVGRLIIDANMGGEWPDTTDDAKVAAGTELVRTIMSRLP